MIDASIYQLSKPVEAPSYLDSAQKAMSLSALAMQNKHMARQSAMQDREDSDNQAMRSAFSKNVGPDGSVNRDAVLSDLAKSGLGMKSLEVGASFKKMDADALENQSKILESHMNQMGAAAQLAMSAKDQASYEAALGRAAHLGMDVSQMPKQFDPGLVRNYAFNSMKQSDRLAAEKQRVDEQIARQKMEQDDRQKLAEMTGNAQLLGIRGKQAMAQIEARGAQDRLTKGVQSGDSAAKMGADNDPYKMSTDFKLKKLNETGKARLDNVRMAHEAISGMADALAGGDNTFSIIGDNNFTMAERNFTEALGRMQSGGAINKQEEKRFAMMAPKFNDSVQIKQQKLEKMQKEMGDRFRTLGFEPSEFGLSTQIAHLDGAPASAAKSDGSMVKNANASDQAPSGVRMIAPDGSVRYIPESQVGEAIAAGGRKASK